MATPTFFVRQWMAMGRLAPASVTGHRWASVDGVRNAELLSVAEAVVGSQALVSVHGEKMAARPTFQA